MKLLVFLVAMGFSAPTRNYSLKLRPAHPGKGEVAPFALSDNHGPILVVDKHGHVFVEGEYVATSKRAVKSFMAYGTATKKLKDAFKVFDGVTNLSDIHGNKDEKLND